MSHFAILVTGPDIATALAPFQENNMGDCPPEYMTFDDVEDEHRADYETGSTEMVEVRPGVHVHSWDDRFRVPGTFGVGADTHKVPDHLRIVSVPHKERYKTFAAFMKDWAGYSKRDPKTGRYGSWDNPNKKWDWYQIGGRYSGRLPTADGCVDQARKGDVDFTPRRDESERTARANFAKWAAAREGRPVALSWPEVRAANGDNTDAARAAYNAQPAIVEWKKSAGTWESFDVDPPLDYGTDLDAYVTRERRKAGTLFGYLHNGEWVERGEMGWWGVVRGEQDALGWCDKFEAFWASLPNDTLVSVIDCHI